MREEDAGSSFFATVIECFAPCKADTSKIANGTLSDGKYGADWGKRHSGSAIGSIRDAISRGERRGSSNTNSGTERFHSKKHLLDKNDAASLEVNPSDDSDPHVRAARAEQIRVNLERQMESMRVAKEKGYSHKDAVELSTGIRVGELQSKQLSSLFRTTRTGSDKFASQILGVHDEISRVTRIGLIDQEIERRRQVMEDRKHETPAEEARRKSRESMGSFSGSFNSRITSMDKSSPNSGSPAGSRPGSFNAKRHSSSMNNLFADDATTPRKEHGSPASSRPTSGSFNMRRSSTGGIP